MLHTKFSENRPAGSGEENFEGFLPYEPRCEKTGLRGFRPGPTQTRLHYHTRWLEA